jgi:hypothetical protein
MGKPSGPQAYFRALFLCHAFDCATSKVRINVARNSRIDRATLGYGDLIFDCDPRVRGGPRSKRKVRNSGAFKVVEGFVGIS